MRPKTQPDLLARCQDPQRPRIVITRLSAIGDTILTLPLLCALRRSFPQAYLAWITEPAPAQLLAGHPALDDLLVIPKHWVTSRRAWQEVVRLRSHNFDISIDPQGLTKSALIGWIAGAGVRIGFTGPRARECSYFWYTHRITPQATHIVDCQLELLALLGIVGGQAEFQLPEYAAEKERVEQYLTSSQLGSPFVVIHTAASWPSRCWPVDRFCQVAKYLWQTYDVKTLVVWGSPQERLCAVQMVEAARECCVLAPATSLRELVCILRRAWFVIAGDSGPLHAAVAAGTPVVGLYGPTLASQSGPYGSQHRVVQAPVRVARRARRTDRRAMESVEVSAVCAACDELCRQRLSATSPKFVDQPHRISRIA